MIGRTLLVIGSLVLTAWALWVKWSRDEPTPWQRMIGRRLMAVGITIVFIGAILRLVVRT